MACLLIACSSLLDASLESPLNLAEEEKELEEKTAFALILFIV